jgi:hypothetical protein
MMLILEPIPQARRLARKRIMVVNYPDGRFALQHRGSDLPFRVFDKIRTLEQAPIVENKRLGPALALIKERQAALPAHQRRLDPARYRHRNNLEAPSLAAT